MTRRPIQDCKFPWSWLVVDARGEARPCCHTPVAVGNITRQTMAEIWEGPVMVRLRTSISDGYIDPICRNAACGFVRDTERLYGSDAYFRYDLDKEYGLQAGEITHICSSGWSYPEYWGVWSDGDRAKLELDLREKPSTDIRLYIHCRSVGHDGYRSPIVRIQVNGSDLGCWEFNCVAATDQLSWRSVTIPARIFADSRLQISFLIDGPLSPSLWGALDVRQLGIGISTLKLTTG
jgi:hypothetical protein